MKCSLCKNPADTDYAVERDNPKPLCSACFGRWGPKELDALLGVKPPYTYIPMATPSRPSVAGTVLSHLDADLCQPASSPIHSSGGRAAHPPGPPLLNPTREGNMRSWITVLCLIILVPLRLLL